MLVRPSSGELRGLKKSVSIVWSNSRRDLGNAILTFSYPRAACTKKCPWPKLNPINVYAMLCQSMMNVAFRKKATSLHTAKAGTHGGVCSKTKCGRFRRTNINTVSCTSCSSTRTASPSAVGSRLSHAGGGGIKRKWMWGCAKISPRGVEPVYATTSTSKCAWSAKDNAWNCILGDRPKSPSTTTCTLRRARGSVTRDDPRGRPAMEPAMPRASRRVRRARVAGGHSIESGGPIFSRVFLK